MTADEELRRALEDLYNNVNGGSVSPDWYDGYRQGLGDGSSAALAARSEPRAEGLRENDVRGHFPYHEYPHPTDHTHATPPAEGLDLERLARAYAEAGYGPALTDEEWQDIAREYAALAPEQPE